MSDNENEREFEQLIDMLVVLIKKHVELVEITTDEMKTERDNYHEALLMRLIKHHKSVHSLFNYVMEKTGSIELAASLQNRFPSPMRFVISKEQLEQMDATSLLSEQLTSDFKRKSK